MSLADYATVLRKRWFLVVAMVLLSLLASVLVGFLTSERYEATTRLFFAVPGGTSVSDLAQGSSFTERQMSSYAQVATSPLVLDRVAAKLDDGLSGGNLQSMVRASVPLGTVILEITAESPSAKGAAEIANLVGGELATVVATLYPPRADGEPAVLATTVTPATPAERPTEPVWRLNLAIGLLLGVCCGVGLAVARELSDTVVRGEEDLSRVSERPILASVEYENEARQRQVAAPVDPMSRRAESIRRLRTNLQYFDAAEGIRSILVTSSVPSEGKTTTAISLAAAFADAGRKVLLVDGDLRRPSLAESLGLEGTSGLTSILVGRASFAEVAQTWRDSLDVLTSGPVPPNPSELLGSDAMGRFLDEASSRYGLIILDSAPLLPVTDSAVLANRVDGAIVVVGAGRVNRKQLRTAIEALDTVRARVLGVVLNCVSRTSSSGYGASYTYGYVPATVLPTGDGSDRRRGRRSASGVVGA